MTFRITQEPLDPALLAQSLEDPRAGAWVEFTGRVRDHNDGQSVQSLEYEAHGPLAEKEGARILEEAAARFSFISAACVHRVGALKIGDIAVWVGVSAAHRDSAFAACRWIIDEAKARIPIWKKEHYRDGEPQWINCATRSSSQEPGQPA